MNRWRHRIIRRLFLIVARPMFRLRIEGAERVPRSGAVILVAKHRSWLDPPLVGSVSRRPVHFLILEDVYDKRWARWFYRWMKTIPVSADSGSSLRAMRDAMRRLRAGERLGVFPEGRVFTDTVPGEFRPGAALLALRSGAPLVPVQISGSAEAWPRGRRWPRRATVSVRVGSPIAPNSGGGETVRELIGRVEAALGERT